MTAIAEIVVASSADQRAKSEKDATASQKTGNPETREGEPMFRQSVDVNLRTVMSVMTCDPAEA